MYYLTLLEGMKWKVSFVSSPASCLSFPTFQQGFATSTTQYFLQILENKHLSINNLPISIWIWNLGNADMKNGNILLSTVYAKLRKSNSRLENIEINKCAIDDRWHSIWFNS